jgi:hypothetical protein
MLKFLSVTTNCKPEWRLARNTSHCLVVPLDIPACVKHCWNVLLVPDKHNNDCAYANRFLVADHGFHVFELNTSHTMAVCFLGWRTLLYGCLGFYSDWLHGPHVSMTSVSAELILFDCVLKFAFYLQKMNDLYSLPNIVQVVKSRQMRWAGPVARMGEDRGVHRVLVGEAWGKVAIVETKT